LLQPLRTHGAPEELRRRSMLERNCQEVIESQNRFLKALTGLQILDVETNGPTFVSVDASAVTKVLARIVEMRSDRVRVLRRILVIMKHVCLKPAPDHSLGEFQGVIGLL
jgi:hypothetical protein